MSAPSLATRRALWWARDRHPELAEAHARAVEGQHTAADLEALAPLLGAAPAGGRALLELSARLASVAPPAEPAKRAAPKGERFVMRLEAETRRALEELADAQRVGLSEAARLAILEARARLQSD